MEFILQHNGKGKTHLLSNDLDLLCGSFGEFNFSPTTKLQFENDNFYEIFEGAKTKISKELLEVEYCKKCLKKIKL